MSTHATITIRNSFDSTPLVTIYSQFDGYFEGLGEDLEAFLKDYTVVNGIRTINVNTHKIANGMGCLAAQIIAHLKREPGSYYIAPAEDAGNEEFAYDIFLQDGKIHLFGRDTQADIGKQFLPK